MPQHAPLMPVQGTSDGSDARRVAPLNLSDTPLLVVRRNDSPMLAACVSRILQDAIDSEAASACFNSAI